MNVTPTRTPAQPLLSLAVVLCLAGCGGPEIDGTSETAMRESVQAIQEDLSEEELRAFQSGLRDLLQLYLWEADGVTELAIYEFDGMTADDVIGKGATAKEEYERLIGNSLEDAFDEFRR